MPCKATLYRLRKSNQIWETWNTVRSDLAATLSKYRKHEILLTYNEQDMKHALLLQRRAREKKKAH